MLSIGEIEATSIEEIKANFFDLMDTIVTTYGDKEEGTTDQQPVDEGEAQDE